MGDEYNDVDTESDDDLEGEVEKKILTDKRAHHNALERKRRDHIKDSFIDLKDVIPQLQGDKTPRVQILKKAADYINVMTRKRLSQQQDLYILKKQNEALETECKKLEAMRKSNRYAADNRMLESLSPERGYGTDTWDSETPQQSRRIKRGHPKGHPASNKQTNVFK